MDKIKDYGLKRRGATPFSLFIIIGSIFLVGTKVLSQNTPEKLIKIEEIYSLEGKEDTNFYFYWPSDMETDSKGNIYVVDTYNNRIQIFDSQGNFLRTIGKYGEGPLDLNKPEDACVDEKNKNIFIADTRNRRIQICSFDGKFIKSIRLDIFPQRIEVIGLNLYISSLPVSQKGKEKALIKKMDKEGRVVNEFISPINTKELALYLLYNTILMKKDKNGNLVIARKFGVNEILIFDSKDKLQKKFEIIYKASKWVKPGIFDFKVEKDEDLNKVSFLIGDLTFDSKNNYYFLAGNIEKRVDGTFERRREIYKYNSKGAYIGTIILPLPVRLIHIDGLDNLYVIDDDFILRKYRILNQE